MAHTDTDTYGSYTSGTYSDGSAVRVYGRRNGFAYVSFERTPEWGVTKVPESWVTDTTTDTPADALLTAADHLELALRALNTHGETAGNTYAIVRTALLDMLTDQCGPEHAHTIYGDMRERGELPSVVAADI